MVGDVFVTIFNAVGQLITNEMILQNGKQQFDFSILPAGMYHYVATNSVGKILTGKIVLEN